MSTQDLISRRDAIRNVGVTLAAAGATVGLSNDDESSGHATANNPNRRAYGKSHD